MTQTGRHTYVLSKVSVEDDYTASD